jgi:NADH dehydrogenase
MTNKPKQKVLVVGGGFAGLQLVKSLRHDEIEITLLDQRNHHLFQPLLYQVATSILPTSEIAWPIRHVLRRRKDVTTLLGTVTAVDSDAKRVHLADNSTLDYDILVLATGARHSYFGNDEWESAAPGLKTLEDATTIRRRLLTAFERAESAASKAEREALLTFAIIGAGPTGVELAGIIVELAHETLRPEFRNIDTREAKVILVEAGPTVLPAFPDKLSNYTKAALESLGVTILTNQPVTECTEQHIIAGEQKIPCRTVVWAAGVAASPAAMWLNAEADRAGRTMVNKDLSVPGLNNVFVIGDTAAVQQANGDPVPGIAPAAKQQGQYVARVIANRLNGKQQQRDFKYKHAGNLATIGKGAAVVDLGRIQLSGTIAWWVWGIAHIYFLIGTRSRIAVAWSWLWSYLTGHNNARLITQTNQDKKPT